MATQTPGVIRAQVVFQGGSGLPEDRYVNTFHFTRRSGAGPLPDEGFFADMGSFRDEIATRLHEFYADAVEGSGTVFNWFGNSLDPNYQIRVYDLGEPSSQHAPRQAYVAPRQVSGTPGAGLPTENAVVMSFFAERNLPRQRGRIFLGPLAQTAVTVAPSGTVPRVNSIFVQTILGAAERLASPGVGDNLQWSVFSPTDNEARRVTGGWVDDEFDHVLKRGGKARSRASWSIPN